MGGGTYNSSASTARLADARTRGVDLFAHTVNVRSGRTAAAAHEDLSPLRKNNNGPFAGEITRECADSDEHPNALPVAVFFDVTGSMGGIPRVLRDALPQLQGLIQRKGYAEDPQILFGAVGDGYSDRVPLQVSQFESDNKMDTHLENIYLEGGGGGGNHESYELAAYFMARHSHIDSYEKRGKKGYIFIIGDERVYEKVTRQELQKVFGNDYTLPQEDLDTKQIFEELQERYHVFFLYASQASYSVEAVLDGTGANAYHYGQAAIGWREVLGQNALVLDDAEDVCNTIATTIGLMEGTLTHDRIEDDLSEVGASARSAANVSRALARVVPGENSGTSVTTVIGTLPDVHNAPINDGGTERL